MDIYLYIYYSHTHTYIRVYIYIYIYIYIYASTDIGVCMYTHRHECMHMNMYVWRIQILQVGTQRSGRWTCKALASTCEWYFILRYCIYIHTYIHTDTLLHTFINMRTHIHIHIHMHYHTGRQPPYRTHSRYQNQFGQLVDRGHSVPAKESPSRGHFWQQLQRVQVTSNAVCCMRVFAHIFASVLFMYVLMARGMRTCRYVVYVRKVSCIRSVKIWRWIHGNWLETL